MEDNTHMSVVVSASFKLAVRAKRVTGNLYNWATAKLYTLEKILILLKFVYQNVLKKHIL